LQLYPPLLSPTRAPSAPTRHERPGTSPLDRSRGRPIGRGRHAWPRGVRVRVEGGSAAAVFSAPSSLFLPPIRAPPQEAEQGSNRRAEPPAGFISAIGTPRHRPKSPRRHAP
jgi:hypothetical protein